MKLIIELDEKTYKEIKTSNTIKEHLNKVDWSIRNGKPYKPVVDLISREALKEAVKNRFDNSEYFPFHFLALIDNALPVDAYEQGYADGWKERFGEPDGRPKGAWLAKEETPASVSYYCSVCKTEGIPVTPFCPWCGADMKGSANE